MLKGKTFVAVLHLTVR